MPISLPRAKRIPEIFVSAAAAITIQSIDASANNLSGGSGSATGGSAQYRLWSLVCLPGQSTLRLR